MTNKLPAMQFYPGDWRKDPGVQSLDYFDRGVWFEILCLMHESDERGRLLLNGKPMPDAALARLLGLDNQILTKTLETLLEYGVATRDEQGTIINRRMMRDENLRQIRTNCGKKGGNPLLVNQNSEVRLTKTEPKPKTELKQKSTPSSSSSISSSSSEVREEAATKPPGAAKTSQEDFIAKLKANPAYAHIDIEREAAKALVWCDANNRKNTPRFFVNWLNRIEPTIKLNGHRVGSNGNRFHTPDTQDEPPTRILKPRRPPDDSPTEHRAVWTAVCDFLRTRVDDDVYQTWFAAGVVFDGLNESCDALKVRAGQVTHDWITLYYSDLIYEALTATGLGGFTFEWEIEQDEYEEETI